MTGQANTTILGIETSCDETAAAIVARDGGGRGTILSNVVRSQLAEHAAYGVESVQANHRHVAQFRQLAQGDVAAL